MASPVATVWAQFKLDMSDFGSKLAGAAKTMRGFANAQQQAMKSTNQGYSSANAMIKSFNRSLSDTVNITRGIIISQAFYAAVGAIQDATSALWDFNKELDYAQVTYSALFGDTQLASNFMSVLQEHAIETIFDYQDLAGISKKLLAYGIEYKNLMFVMEGLTNLGTMSGDPAALDRIALALGQIYTKGKLSAEEMRQLANAYVPITEIITEKFNLSEDDLKRVGDLNLPAEQVINAIVDYANENFGSVGDAAMYTITGLEAKIVDTLKTVGAEMIKPLTTAYKSFLVFIADGLADIREAFAEGGLGGVFEYLVPDENTQKTIRMMLANIKNLFNSIMSLAKALGPTISNVAQVFAAVFNAVVPAITAVINALAIVVNAMTSTSAGAATLRMALVAAAGAFVLMRVQAIGALIVTVVTKAVNALSKSLLVLANVISKHPILSLLAMLGIALLGISVSSDNANSSLSGFFDTLASAGGSSSGDILQDTDQSIQDANDALDDFNNRLEEGKDEAEDLEDGINGVGSAAKRTKNLLSFDEVFKLNEPGSSGSGSGSGYDDLFGDIEGIVGGLGSLGDALIPEIPDFSEFIGDYSDSLLGGLSDGLNDKIAAGSWGSIIGGILGGLIGLAFKNPVLGAKIGMAAGAFVGVLFDEMEYAISNTGTGTFAGIAGAIAKAFGASFGDVVKTLVSTGSIDDFFKSIAAIFSATGAKSLLKGGVIGFAVGLFVDGLAHLLWTSMEERFENADAETAKIGQTIGSLIGMAIGAIIGGPAGALIGSAIGTFAGGLVGLFWEPIKEYFDPDNNPLTAFWLDHATRVVEWYSLTFQILGNWVTSTIEIFSGWWTDTTTGFSGWWERTTGGFTTWWSDTKSGFSEWWTDTFSGLSEWWANTVAIFSDWSSINGDTLKDWASDTWDELSGWTSDTWGTLTGWFDDTLSSFGDWCSDTFWGFIDWHDDSKGVFKSWREETKEGLWQWTVDTLDEMTWWRHDVLGVIEQWAEDTWGAIKGWVTNTLETIGNWVTDIVDGFEQFSSDAQDVIIGFGIAFVRMVEQDMNTVYTTVRTWFTDLVFGIGAWLNNIFNSIRTWFTGTTTSIKTWWNNMFDYTKWSSGWDLVFSWFGALKNTLSTWFAGRANDVKNWWNGLFNYQNWTSGWDLISQWFTNLFNSISGWFSGLKSNISSWWSGLFSGLPDISISGIGDFISGALKIGHADGGIFNREHVARFAEGNKAEAVIPLENARAMQPFVDAVSNGIVSSLAPIVATIGSSSNSNNLPPMYIGTLVADERGLKQLYNKFELIRVQEDARKGLGG